MLLPVSLVIGQEFSPLEVFTAKDYNAGNQNWSIAQANNKTIFIANNKGLLEYNGARWNLYATQNQAIIRSVAVIDDKVYTGSYMDFGFWERNAFGNLEYTSLNDALEEDFIQDEEFWNIIPMEEWILFQSLDRLYIFNTKTNSFRILNSDSRITKVYNVNGIIYFQRLTEGLYKIENGRAVLASNDPIVTDNEIINVFDVNGKLLVLTKQNGFYWFEGNSLERWNTDARELLSKVSVYSAIQLRNGNFILGTISDGIIKITKDGKLLFWMNQEDGLSNNTVLTLFEDNSENVWIGLDNGVDVLNLKSPYKVYNDRNGKLGTIYTSAKTEKYLYLGTNQGLFYRSIDSEKDFELVPGTQGQVWVLKMIDDTLLCGHDNGTYQIFEEQAVKIASENGTWDIKTIAQNPNILLQGNYNGLSLLEFKDGQWGFKQKVKGFDISSRYFEFSKPNELLVSHEYRGVFKLKLNDNLQEVTSYTQDEVPKSIGSSLFKYNDKVMYATNEGIYSYQDNTFAKDSLLQDYFNAENYVSGKLIFDTSKKRLWAFYNNQIVYVEPGNLTEELQINNIDLPATLRKSNSGFENILSLSDDSYLLGTTEGYIIIDLQKSESKDYDVRIDKVSFGAFNQDQTNLKFNDNPKLKNQENNLEFLFSVSDYNSLTPSFYQYKLKGISKNWSPWSEDTSVLFENLPYGDYTFEVRAKVGDSVTDNIASYTFSIEKPWHLKPLAIVGYVLFFIMIIGLILFLNTRYYKKQQAVLLTKKERELEYKEIENQRQQVEFKNQNLQQDIENKNRELGMATMNLVKRNELLNDIKTELSKTKTEKDIKNVIKLIDKNLNDSKDWKLFEEAFNNVDKDFLKRIKKIHPSLTPNDLKLCAYLRLNLSSKEVAPLLNISHRSVEVKRYRLRKKMNLSHESSLTNYILEI
ncbi:LuxR family transcriptional regulator [Flavobacteriaceae bacterium R38]|nr:LuxR family transcriptional regulator [Flavobacteriaceae bacterium R38]